MGTIAIAYRAKNYYKYSEFYDAEGITLTWEPWKLVGTTPMFPVSLN